MPVLSPTASILPVVMTLRANSFDVELIRSVISSSVVVLMPIASAKNTVRAVFAWEIVGMRNKTLLNEVIHATPCLLLIAVPYRDLPPAPARMALLLVAFPGSAIPTVPAPIR